MTANLITPTTNRSQNAAGFDPDRLIASAASLSEKGSLPEHDAPAGFRVF